MITPERLEEIALMAMQAMNRNQHKRFNDIHRDHKRLMTERLKQECAVTELTKTVWFASGGVERTACWLKDDAVSLSGYVKALAETPGDPDVLKTIDQAVDALTEALLSAKLSQSTYRKTIGTKIGLVAAE